VPYDDTNAPERYGEVQVKSAQKLPAELSVKKQKVVLSGY